MPFFAQPGLKNLNDLRGGGIEIPEKVCAAKLTVLEKSHLSSCLKNNVNKCRTVCLVLYIIKTSRCPCASINNWLHILYVIRAFEHCAAHILMPEMWTRVIAT